MILNWPIFLAGIAYLTYALACALGGQEIYLFGDSGIFLDYARHPLIITAYFGFIALCTLLAGTFVIGSMMPGTSFGRATAALWTWLDKRSRD